MIATRGFGINFDSTLAAQYVTTDAKSDLNNLSFHAQDRELFRKFWLFQRAYTRKLLIPDNGTPFASFQPDRASRKRPSG
jgi:hypothetical protein